MNSTLGILFSNKQRTLPFQTKFIPGLSSTWCPSWWSCVLHVQDLIKDSRRDEDKVEEARRVIHTQLDCANNVHSVTQNIFLALLISWASAASAALLRASAASILSLWIRWRLTSTCLRAADSRGLQQWITPIKFCCHPNGSNGMSAFENGSESVWNGINRDSRPESVINWLIYWDNRVNYWKFVWSDGC